MTWYASLLTVPRPTVIPSWLDRVDARAAVGTSATTAAAAPLVPRNIRRLVLRSLDMPGLNQDPLARRK